MTNQEYKMKISKDKIYEIYTNYYLKGVSAYKLEKQFNLGTGYLYRWFNKLNLPLRDNSINSKKISLQQRLL